MKIYIIGFVCFVILGALTGLFFIKKISQEQVKTVINTNEKITYDINSLPPVDLIKNTDDSPDELNIKSAEKYSFQVDKNKYQILLPKQCTAIEAVVSCKGEKEFQLQVNVSPDNISDSYTNTQTFSAGEYELTISSKNKETLFTIIGKDKIYFIANGASYDEIAKDVLAIISTFSLVNSDL